MKINVALFGLGRIGMMHAKNIYRHPRFKLKYVYDINKKASVNASKKFNAKNINNPSFAFKDKKMNCIPNNTALMINSTTCARSKRDTPTIGAAQTIDIKITLPM